VAIVKKNKPKQTQFKPKTKPILTSQPPIKAKTNPIPPPHIVKKKRFLVDLSCKKKVFLVQSGLFRSVGGLIKWRKM